MCTVYVLYLPSISSQPQRYSAVALAAKYRYILCIYSMYVCIYTVVCNYCQSHRNLKMYSAVVLAAKIYYSSPSRMTVLCGPQTNYVL